MGYNIRCPFPPAPTGKPDESFLETIRLIE